MYTFEGAAFFLQCGRVPEYVPNLWTRAPGRVHSDNCHTKCMTCQDWPFGQLKGSWTHAWEVYYHAINLTGLAV